jgi:hypothetical protein
MFARKRKGVIKKHSFSNDDVFLVSYPKSGSTWIRFLFGNYFSGNKCDFTNYHFIVPDLHCNSNNSEILKTARFFKSHQEYNPRLQNVVYLVRDGRDVAVSYYYHAIKYRKISSKTKFIDFVNKYNSRDLDNFGIWSEHVKGWIEGATKNFLLMKYEDILSNPIQGLNKILQFASIDPDLDAVRDAVTASEFKKMKMAEEDQYENCDTLSGSDATISFIRNGKPGEWKKYFSPELLADFIDIHGAVLKELGYIF